MKLKFFFLWYSSVKGKLKIEHLISVSIEGFSSICGDDHSPNIWGRVTVGHYVPYGCIQLPCALWSIKRFSSSVGWFSLNKFELFKMKMNVVLLLEVFLPSSLVRIGY